ncbi:type 1 glutamine amidotransferase [Sulfuracidifex tepidarius]|uniref:GMP synthase [glutamine-hydrolyzing] subunit A n=1 Tax=Sulfuracidifex tepidarius TaxID=1294262 RepID=A0A510DY25_9CREN|nr:type 1 glutamine amidotransferase [Sulfuracidifex tepidarius]BBG25124.1 GMP synthase [glutamine-hydrolyzing] subunit A [Sulfuracidifex tepidarius]BBG27911.1 GMP synthase [glutamine-hydrolyzing] subunit A [Sulfuracidifex tepidarius]
MMLGIIHHPVEGLGNIKEILKEKDDLREVRADELTGKETPDSIVLMGGPMGVYEHDRYPFMEKEFELIKRTPKVLGICLGAQLLSYALGGKVTPGSFGEEKGIMKVRTVSYLKTLGDIHVFQWHSDTFTLPEGADLLAYSDKYFQAFLKERRLGLQFHIEVDAKMVKSWIETYGGNEEIVNQVKEHEEELFHTAKRIIKLWFDL